MTERKIIHNSFQNFRLCRCKTNKKPLSLYITTNYHRTTDPCAAQQAHPIPSQRRRGPPRSSYIRRSHTHAQTYTHARTHTLAYIRKFNRRHTARAHEQTTQTTHLHSNTPILTCGWWNTQLQNIKKTHRKRINNVAFGRIVFCSLISTWARVYLRPKPRILSVIFPPPFTTKRKKNRTTTRKEKRLRLVVIQIHTHTHNELRLFCPCQYLCYRKTLTQSHTHAHTLKTGAYKKNSHCH